MSRQSKLTPEIHKQIVDLIRIGNTVELAAQAAGVSESAFYGWMDRGTKGGNQHAPYREFRADIERVRAESEAILVGRIARAAGNGSWSAAAWLLERGHPERWAKQTERKNGDGDQAEEAKNPAEAIRDELAARRAGRA